MCNSLFFFFVRVINDLVLVGFRERGYLIIICLLFFRVVSVIVL